jgi:hypothetical protein
LIAFILTLNLRAFLQEISSTLLFVRTSKRPSSQMRRKGMAGVVRVVSVKWMLGKKDPRPAAAR